MDQITIKDLAAPFHIGVPDAERAQPQQLAITITLELDTRPAAARDDLSQTIDYHALADRVLQFGQGRSWKLLETLANDLADAILLEFKPLRLTLQIKKFILPKTKYISVQITRSPSG
jgi:7,8-dihydroneopterin aldolase/epimerase/oxygenase